MKRLLVACVAAATFWVSPAFTAKAAPPPVPAVNWSGWYVGVNAGGNWNRSNATTVDRTNGIFCCNFAAEIAATGAQTINTSGFTGGIQGGYNWQSGNFLAGIEADFEALHSAGSKSVTAVDICCAPATNSVATSVSTNWLFTARPRFGMVANNWLFYATGGLAVTQLTASWNFFESSGPSTESASASTTKAGWTFGGGLETRLPGNWSIGAEYLYVKFNNITVNSSNFVNVAFGPTTEIFSHSVNLESNIVRLRLNKTF